MRKEDIEKAIQSDAHDEDVCSFNVRLYPAEDEVPSSVYGTMPVYYDGILIGFFFMLNGGRAKVFLARDNRAAGGPYFSTGSEYYFSINDSHGRARPYGRITDVPEDDSVKLF